MRDINVLVTGAGGPLGQSIMKAVRRVNLPCRLIATDSNRFSVGFHWADNDYTLPLANDPDYLTQLEHICLKEYVDAVLIGSEGEMHVLASQKAYLERRIGSRIIVSSPEVLRISTDKWETVCFLKAHDFDYPRSALPKNKEQLETLVEEKGFPLIVKPRRGSGSQGLFRVHDRRELTCVLQLANNPIVQECLLPDDQEYTTAAFVDDTGQPQGAIVMLRELAAGLTYRAAVLDHPLVAKTAQEVAGTLQPLGPCNIQLRLTDRGPVPFEINARFSSTTGMRAYYGYNEVEMALRCYVLDEQIAAPRSRFGVALRFWDELYLPQIIDPATDSFFKNTRQKTQEAKRETKYGSIRAA